MSYNFEEFEVGDTIKRALARARITNTRHLLEKCATLKDRVEVAKQTGLDVAELLKLVRAADLLRVKHVGPESQRLLHAAGVETVKQLQKQDPETLTAKLAVTNGNKRKPIMEREPKLKAVAVWVEGAKALPIIVIC
jgi:nucleotidyltransferase/DNA polymerase involved in DNA repair